MKKISVFLVLLALIPLSSHAELKFSEIFSLPGFSQPESVVYDAANKVYYVSNVAGAPNEKDGKGFISRVSEDGTKIEKEWITGFNAPKGLALFKGHLFTSDIDVVVEMEVASGKIVKTYPVNGAKFLNDVAVTSQGYVYISDMLGDSIYKIANGELTSWLKSSALQFPNGLFVEGDFLILGSWGVITDGFKTAVPGFLQKISLTTKEIKPIGKGTPEGNLDGVEGDGNGNYFVTDWLAGKLLGINASGSKILKHFNPGSADLTFIKDKKILVIPLMNDGVVKAYRVDELHRW